ncbi:hypothetical protein OCO53_26575 [Peribacillus frigoritolerans]|uniref:hypothetical protein n=1 Tax=Peribacillus frigoritolerans TaxID=450367 RepID=UPI0021CFD106|nr:hypothetical protein [Peribacillus frigoritolerans]MCU6604003.1 hypothetical protein [Peribacillus frigoritolerans]
MEIILLTLKSAASARLSAKPNQSKRFRLTSHSARVWQIYSIVFKKLTPLSNLNGAFFRFSEFIMPVKGKALVSFEDHGQAFKSTSAFMRDQ